MRQIYRLLCIGILLSLIGAKSLRAQGVDYLLPRPQILHTEANKVLKARGFALQAEALKTEYSQYLHDLGWAEGMHYKTKLVIKLVDSLPEVERGLDEAYRLVIDSLGISVQATSERGAYWALQTLRQLSDRGKALPQLSITDWPNWSVRGLMHDVGRTFIPMGELKKQVVLLSRFKLNAFHWHLTDNQAWRLESKHFPQLTSIAATERMPGQYYTLEDAKELAEWCRQHQVLLIPEIDMPGHSAAFDRAMGFGMQTPEGKQALKIILQEALRAMDVPYIHLGTDEVKFTDSDFVPEMVTYVRALGKKAISWNPGWDYKTGEIDMIHMWSYRGRPLAKTPSIDSRLHYINHYDTFSDLVALYNARIARQDHASDELAGAILAVWNDRYIESTEQIIADNHVYATSLALAERAWLGGGRGYFDGKTSLLWSREDKQYTDFADFERRLLHYKATLLRQEPIPYIKQTHAVWQIIGSFPNGGDLTKVFAPETELLRDSRQSKITPPSKLLSYKYEGQSIQAKQVFGSGFYLRHVWGPSITPGLIEKPEENRTAYAVAWVHSPKPQKAGLMLETQNYSRSESDLPPPIGKWDYRESRFWLNGKEIPAPIWTATHSTPSNEVPLGNENASSRPPIVVSLRSGWNMLLIKLPVGQFQSRETRLVKWMFTASFVTLDGREALPLRYHYLKP